MILDSLPAMPVLEERDRALDFIASLASASDAAGDLGRYEAAGV